MANACRVQIAGCAFRATRLALDGSPVAGANQKITLSTMVEMTFTPEYDEGEEILLKNACGDICVNFRFADKLKRVTVEFSLCTVDPQAMELLAGGTLLTSGSEKGYGYPTIGTDPTPNGVGIEVWAKRIDSSGSLDSTGPYARWLFPRVYVRHGAKTFGAAPQVTTFTGFGLENSQWLDGGENDWPVASSSVAQWIPVSTLPTTSCGYETGTGS